MVLNKAKHYLNSYSVTIYWVIVIFLLINAGHNFLYNLGTSQIVDWDEARHGVSAYEMIKNNNYFVNTYSYQPDFWNLKPPLSFWSIVLGYKIAGFNPLGLRLFSAIFALLTLLIIILFVQFKHGNLASILSGVVFTTSTQYLFYHGARTADADSLFVLLFTSAIVSVLLVEQNTKWLYLAGVMFSLAFLTKSWHAISIMGVIFCYLLISFKKLNLSIKNYLFFLLSVVVPIFLWLACRYPYDGLSFLKEMINYDLLARTSRPLEGHTGGKDYYFGVLKQHYVYWLLVLIAVLSAYLSRVTLISQRTYHYLIGIFLWIGIPFILFSIAKTKIPWYILPIYPPLAIVIGVLSAKILSLPKKIEVKILLSLFLLFSIYQYEKFIIETLHSTSQNSEQSMQMLLQDFQESKSYNGKKLIYYNPSNKDELSQSLLLAGELYGDFKMFKGTPQDLEKDPSALLMFAKAPETERLITDYNLVVINNNEWGYVTSKNSLDQHLLNSQNHDKKISILEENTRLTDNITIQEIFIYPQLASKEYKVVVKFSPGTKPDELANFKLKFHLRERANDIEFKNLDFFGDSAISIEGQLYLINDVKSEWSSFEQLDIGLYQTKETREGVFDFINHGEQITINRIINLTK
ncbi:ArnT family glycosyltransferase [Paenibacillus sp. S-38]|uniref:ArnT family glycosyltransferase n=1 Tax=Paenibacillus sp. S-38 TaxID=3416710 RepID=UPI003CE9DD7F